MDQGKVLDYADPLCQRLLSLVSDLEECLKGLSPGWKKERASLDDLLVRHCHTFSEFPQLHKARKLRNGITHRDQVVTTTGVQNAMTSVLTTLPTILGDSRCPKHLRQKFGAYRPTLTSVVGCPSVAKELPGDDKVSSAQGASRYPGDQEFIEGANDHHNEAEPGACLTPEQVLEYQRWPDINEAKIGLKANWIRETVERSGEMSVIERVESLWDERWRLIVLPKLLDCLGEKSVRLRESEHQRFDLSGIKEIHPIIIGSFSGEKGTLTVVEWLRVAGDHIKCGEALFLVRGKYDDWPLPAPVHGTLGMLQVSNGQTVPADTVFGFIFESLSDKLKKYFD